jgi:hypothetical protein
LSHQSGPSKARFHSLAMALFGLLTLFVIYKNEMPFLDAHSPI